MYKLFKKLYWVLTGYYAQLIGTRFYEVKWSRRDIEEVRKGFANINHPHRNWLMEQFDSLYPFSSILELGCGYGPNLQLLAERYLGVKLVGIDINPSSVMAGSSRLKDLGIDNVEILVGNIETLLGFKDKSFDIVFTDAALLYVGSDKINNLIKEMRRISCKALMFVEMHNENLKCQMFSADGWVRNYNKILKDSLPDNSVKLIKIPPHIWKEGRWPEFGYLIVVIIQ